MDTEEVGTLTTDDGLSVETNAETSDAMKANFALEPKPLDGETEDPKEAEKKKRSQAAAELGKAGGEAAAKARAEKDDDDLMVEVDTEGKPVEETEPAKEVKAETGEEEERKANPRHDARARVMEATKKLAEERDKNRDLETRLAALEARITPPKPAEATDEEPVPEGFESYEAYVKSVGKWQARQAIAEERENTRRETATQQATQQATQALVQQVDSFNERLAEAVKADPDLMEKMDQEILSICPTMLLPPNTPPRPENDIAQAVIESEHTAELMLYLSAHPEEMVRLTGLRDSFAVARAMGGLEAKVTTAPAPRLAAPADPEPQVSKAKPPVKPVSGSPQFSEEDVTDDMDLDAHMRIYNAKDERARRGR